MIELYFYSIRLKGRTARVICEKYSSRVCIILVLEKTMFGKANKNWHAAAHDNKSFRIVPRGSKLSQQKCF